MSEFKRERKRKRGYEQQKQEYKMREHMKLWKESPEIIQHYGFEMLSTPINDWVLFEEAEY